MASRLNTSVVPQDLLLGKISERKLWSLIATSSGYREVCLQRYILMSQVHHFVRVRILIWDSNDEERVDISNLPCPCYTGLLLYSLYN